MIVTTIIATLALARQHPEQFSDSWAQVRQAISRSYYARNTRSARMNQLLDKYAPQAKTARTAVEFEATINKMIDEFGDSHFAYLTRSDQAWYMMDGLVKGMSSTPMPNFGAWFRKTSAGYEVSMLLEGTSAQRSGLRKGDIVSTVDGRPFSPVDSIANSVDKTVQLSVLRHGQTLVKTVQVSSKSAMAMFLDATTASERIVEDNGRLIGYIHLWTMANSQFKDALSDAVYGKFKNTDGFILDIRDGFGGRPEGYGDPFFRPDVDLKWVMGGPATDQLFGYGRPLVALVNEGSRSAKEIFSYILKKSHRATLIGHTTAGNVLGTFPQALLNGAILEIPIADVFTDGARLEGRGVSPDVAISPEFDSQGSDMIFARALEALKNVPPNGRMGMDTAQNQVTRKWATAIE